MYGLFYFCLNTNAGQNIQSHLGPKLFLCSVALLRGGGSRIKTWIYSLFQQIQISTYCVPVCVLGNGLKLGTRCESWSKEAPGGKHAQDKKCTQATWVPFGIWTEYSQHYHTTVEEKMPSDCEVWKGDQKICQQFKGRRGEGTNLAEQAIWKETVCVGNNGVSRGQWVRKREWWEMKTEQ